MASLTAQYALRVVISLSRDAHTARTARELSEEVGVPLPYLAKVVQRLSRAGITRSQRGLHGGFMLAREPDALTVYDVVAAVDMQPALISCHLDAEAQSAIPCPLCQRLMDAEALARDLLQSTTIAMLLETAPVPAG